MKYKVLKNQINQILLVEGQEDPEQNRKYKKRGEK